MTIAADRICSHAAVESFSIERSAFYGPTNFKDQLSEPFHAGKANRRAADDPSFPPTKPVRIGSKTNHRIVREVNAAIYRDDALEARRPAFGHVGELVDAIMLIFMPAG
jgi:hypothetical protein